MLNAILILAALFPISAFSSGNDVKPVKLVPGAHYVQVTRTGEYVSFVDCIFNGPTAPCYAPRQIGKRAQYSLTELRDQKTIEYWQAAGAVAGDIAVSFAGLYLGGGIATMYIASDMPGGMLIGAIGGGSGVTAGYIAATTFNALNPLTQYRQAAALQDDVILDQEVISYNINKFIRRLELVLNKLD